MKKQITLFIFIFSLILSKGNSQTVTGPSTTLGFWGGDLCESTPWKLVFHDEFSGTQLDRTKWLSYFPCDAAQSDDCLFSRTHTTSIGSTLETTPLLPWRPANLSPTCNLRLIAT